MDNVDVSIAFKVDSRVHIRLLGNRVMHDLIFWGKSVLIIL